MSKSRRNFLKSGIALASTATAAQALSAPNIINKSLKNAPLIQAKVGQGDFTYRVRKDWGNQDPAKIPVKDCHEMVQDSRGRLLLLTNHTKNNMIIYDRSGKVLDTWTGNWPGAHGLTLHDEGGEEFLYITDPDLHQVYKTTLDGKVLMTLDFPKASGVYQNASEYKPTETAIGPNGDIYVADGYGLNYIIQYTSKGEYIRHFGGTGEGDAQFDCCHGVTLDDRKENTELLITSRTNNRFKRFDLEGNHLETILMPGSFICRPVIKGEFLYFAVLATKTWWAYDGMVAILNADNKVVSLPGGMAPEYNDKGVLKEPVYDEKTLLNPHDVCIDNDENIYVAQWYSGKTYPVMLERV